VTTMKKVFVVFLGVALLCFMAVNADASKNANGKIALHEAGVHSSKVNDCTFVLGTCDDINTDGPNPAAGVRDDVYVIAVDVAAIAGVRFGICCDGDFYFYGWTSCGDFETNSPGWPGCNEGVSTTWNTEQAGPFVTVGILDVFTYASSVELCACADPRVDFLEFCDGTQPLPICTKIYPDNPDWTKYFGCIGYNGNAGYNPCSETPTLQKSWGAVKSLYR
jgi:hypothetical protein